MPRPKGAVNEEWTLNNEEAARLTARVRLLTVPALRSQETKERLKCSEWKAGVGVVAKGVEWVESPALTLERLEGRR